MTIPAEKKEALGPIIGERKEWLLITPERYSELKMQAAIAEANRVLTANAEKRAVTAEVALAEADSRERAAFEAGRKIHGGSYSNTWEYEDFNDYKKARK